MQRIKRDSVDIETSEILEAIFICVKTLKAALTREDMHGFRRMLDVTQCLLEECRVNTRPLTIMEREECERE